MKDSSQDTIISVKNLKKYYPVKRGLLYKTVDWIKAVDDVTLDIEPGKTLGLVGESGCGKTTLGRTIIRLLKPQSGEIRFKGKEIAELDIGQLRPLRQYMQIVFQDPFSSLDPRYPVGRSVSEGLLEFSRLKRTELLKKLKSLFETVGLPSESVNRYPHEFSGGQRQRIGIARALALEPEFVVLDEPVSSLDISIQAQIINLLVKLQNDFNLTYLFIAHDLNVTRHISDDILVMYLGKIVEKGINPEIYQNPLHPYTKILFASVPRIGKRSGVIKAHFRSEPMPFSKLPSGCKFAPRCPYRKGICSQQQPGLRLVGKDRWVACHLR